MNSLTGKSLKSAQIRAARALIRWSAEDLARSSAVGLTTNRPDQRHHDGDGADQCEGRGHLQAERAEQFPAHAPSEALRQNLAHLRFERREVAVVRVEECTDHAAARYGREDVDPTQQPESVERLRQPRWNAIALEPPPDRANPILGEIASSMRKLNRADDE